MEVMQEIDVLREQLKLEQEKRKKAEQLLEQKLAETAESNRTSIANLQPEEAVASSRINAILAAIPDLIIIVNREGRYLDLQHTNLINLAVPVEKLLGKTLHNSLPGELADRALQNIKQAIETGQPVTMDYAIESETGFGLLYREARIVKYSANEALIMVRDLTALKKNELLIQEKSELLSQVVNTSSNLIFVKNEAGRYTFANNTFAEHFGHKPEEIIGRTDHEIHGEMAAEVAYFLEKDRQVLKSGQTQVFEEQFTKQNGEVVWLKTTKKLLLLQGEKHVMGLSSNITAEKNAKEQLEQSEELYRLLSENSKDLIGLHDLNGNYLYVSNAVEEMLGYKPEELLGTSARDITHPDDRDLIHKQKIEKALSEKSNFIVQNRKRRKDGTYIWVESSIRPILDENGHVVKLQSSLRDITERSRAQEELLNSRKKYQDLLNYSPALIFSHDMQGRFIAANYFTSTLIGIKEDEIAGHLLKEFVPADQHAEIDAGLAHLQEQTNFQGVFSAYDESNQIRHLHFYSNKVEEPGAEPYVIVIGYDITERLKMEEELKRAKEAAEESARVKENFLANMSHEIRTPLNGILGMANLLGRTSLDSTQRKYLKLIKSSSDNLLVVINDILDIAKIEAGKIEIEHIPFNLNETLKAAFHTLAYKAEEKEIAYTLAPFRQVKSAVIGDPYRLQQILLNLLNNAIKFTDEGCVSLEARVLTETAQVVTVEFMVCDTGIGIPEDKRQAIFEGFTQAYASITRKYGGTGLGLSICKNLVEMQGGSIWLQSQEGKGSTFRFVLSYPKSSEPLQPEVPQQEVCPQLRKTTILLAEDNEVNICVAEAILQNWGADVTIARNGREAVELASRKRFDVILMDIQMPEMNGLDATRHIRQLRNPALAQVPVIALTANAIKGDAEKYLSMGLDDYVAKPFEEDRLYTTIIRHLKRQQGEISEERTPPVPAAENPAAEQLYSLKSIRMMARGNEAFIRKTVEVFINTIPAAVADMEAKCRQRDWEGVSHLAHKIKSTVAMMHITRVQELVLQIEQNAQAQTNLDSMAGAIETIAEVIGLVAAQLKAVYS